ncbi:MAG: radical SAM protein, partial [bacterium]|nr:radical SAM protein [bacterium]
PLANPSTYEVLRWVHREYPHLHTCVSTNGLLLPDRLDELMDAGLKALTVTINTLNLETAEAIYSWVRYEGRIYRGLEAAELLVQNQWRGLREAAAAGMLVKVNTICLPRINEDEIPSVAEAAGALGARIMNITALIPQGELAHVGRPPREKLDELRLESQGHIRQMSHCRQCRADAAGLWNEEKDMEMEALLAKIGDDYTDAVF